jgi:cytochrome c553
MNRKALVVSTLLACSALLIVINSCTHAPYVMPVSQRTGDPNICFERDVLPIFISNCAKGGCHDAESHKGGYTLDSYSDIVKKGIVPGNYAASVIWESVAIKTFNVTPMPENASGLSAADIATIRAWIAGGAIDSGVACSINPCDSGNFTYSGAIAPLMQKYCTGCHNTPSAAGGSLMDYSSVKDAAVNGRLIGNIEQLPGYDAMPAVGIKLSDCQIAQVTKWVAAGAPND